MNFNEFIEAYRFDPQRDLINEGGFGKVYRAWGEHDREVAIKVCQVQNHKYTLKHEFELAAKLSKHPNIAFYENVYDFDIPGIGKTEYAVMQYYPDGDLRNVIANKILAIEEKADILAGIINGVSFLHQSGIIHRDLKPGNILMQKVQGKWRPKITDFGLGKSFSGNGEISNTSAGIVSLLYASPEQILGKPTLPNTDLWPIGIITYLLFTGKLPFESNLPKDTESYRSDVSRKIISGQIPDSISLIQEPFRSVIKKCLVIDNSSRIQDAKELLTIIQSDYRPVETPVGFPDAEKTKILERDPTNETTIFSAKPDTSTHQNNPSTDSSKKKPKYHWAAIVTFICGLTGLVAIAIIFGIVALTKIKRSEVPIKGKDMAITGLIFSGIWIIVSIILNSINYGN